MPNPLAQFNDRQTRLLYTDPKGSGLVMYSDQILGGSTALKTLRPGRLTDAARAARTDLLLAEGAQIESIEDGTIWEARAGVWFPASIPITANLATGTLADTLLLEKRMSIAQVDGTGAVDDGPRLQEAFDNFIVEGKLRRARMPALGMKYKLTSMGLTINASAAAMDWGQAEIDASGLPPNAIAMKVTGQTIPPYNQGSNRSEFGNFQITGSGSNATTVKGIFLGIDSTVPGHALFKNIRVTGTQDALTIDDHVYILQFQNCHFVGSKRYNINYVGDLDTGESINFFGGSISDAVAANGSAVGLYVPSTAGGPDIIMHGVSMSYNNQAFIFEGGRLNMFGCHLESRNNRPFGVGRYASGKAPTSIFISGGVISHGPIGTETEQTGGRDYDFHIPADSGSRLSFAIENVQWGIYGPEGNPHWRTKLIQNDSTGAQVRHPGVSPTTSGNNFGGFCNTTNVVANGSFEAVMTSGWTQNAPNAHTVFTRINSDAFTGQGSDGGTWSLEMTASGGASAGSMTQDIPVRPGEMFWFLGAYRGVSVTAGFAALKANFQTSAGFTISSISLSGDITPAAAVDSWVFKSMNAVIPAGASRAQITFFNSGSFSGTVRADALRAWSV